MQLFTENSEPFNIVPFDGEAIYYGMIFDQNTADIYFDYLLNNTPWKNDEGIIFGKAYKTERKIAWYSEDNTQYNYSNSKKTGLRLNATLKEIKNKVEEISGVSYNSCLLNLYENGSHGLGWHSDDEKEMGKNSNIASVSLGAVRRFDLRHNGSKETFSQNLEHGSLLIMSGAIQTFWKHQIPKSLKIKEPRINITFRKFLSE